MINNVCEEDYNTNQISEINELRSVLLPYIKDDGLTLAKNEFLRGLKLSNFKDINKEIYNLLELYLNSKSKVLIEDLIKYIENYYINHSTSIESVYSLYNKYKIESINKEKFKIIIKKELYYEMSNEEVDRYFKHITEDNEISKELFYHIINNK